MRDCRRPPHPEEALQNSPARYRSRVRTALFAPVIAVSLTVGGCTAGGDDTPALDSSNDCQEVGRYFVFEDPEWEFREAVDYPPDLGLLEAGQPSLDWYVEHARIVPTSDPGTTEGQHLSISGHEAGIADHARELVGAELSETQVDRRRAFVGTGPGGTPNLVTVATRDDFTIMLLSYELASDELIRLASELEPVCRREWIEAGGQVLDCLPWEAGCIKSLDSSGVPQTFAPGEQRSTSTMNTSTTLSPGIPIGGPELEGAPPQVADRLPLPYCGADIEARGAGGTFAGIEHDPGSHECFASRVEAGLPAELIQARLTVEGDWIVIILRHLADRSVLVYLDATRDSFSTRAWFLFDCASIDTATLEPVGCGDHPLQLTAERS